MSKPNKGRRRSSGAGKGSKEHGGDKKASGATTSADKKAPDATEKKTTGPTSPTRPPTSQSAGAQASTAGSAGKKQPAATDKKESTMKPTESKGGLISKTEPAKKEPEKTEPTKKEPEKTEAAKKEPEKTEPAKKEPEKTEAAKKEPEKTEPAKKEPEKTEAAKKEPAKTEPTKAEVAKTEPAKSAQSTKPVDSKQPKDHAAPKSPTKTSGTTSPSKQPSGGKATPSQDTKPSEAKPKEEPKTKSEKAPVAAASSKSAAEAKGEKSSAAPTSSKPAPESKTDKKAAVAGATATAAVAGGAVAAAVISSNKSAPTKDQKPVAADTASSAGMDDDALDELMGTLEGPEDVPKTPEYTGPVVSDPATSITIKKLGEDDNTIPPEYRHLLDGKDSSGKPIKPEEVPTTPMGEEDLVAALSSDFTCATSPEKKKQKLDEPKPQEGGMDDALDELMGTLEGPGENVPETPTYTGPEITETVTSETLDPLGIRDSTIPPAYRHLLDGKVDGKAAPPQQPESPAPISDADLVDAFSMDFVCSPSTFPGEPEQPLGEEDLVDALSSGFTCSAPLADTKEEVDEGTVDDSALDELMGTLEGAGDPVPESPVYTGPVVTEKSTATYVEELGKRESSIPPQYRKLLDGKDDGKVVPPPAPVKPLSDAELADELSKDFSYSSPSTEQPAAVPAPKGTVDPKTPKDAPAEEITTCATASSVQSAPAPAKLPPAPAKLPPAKTPAKSDPLDALSATLGTGERKPADTKPAVDKLKEKTGKGNVEKLGEREDTIPPEYRLEELKDKDGKPILPKPEAKPKPMSDTELLDALSGDFVSSTATTTQCAPVPAPQGTMKSKDVPSKEAVAASAASTVKSAAAPAPAAGTMKSKDVPSKEAVAASAASTVKSAAAPAPAAKGAASADPLDKLAGTLGKAEPPPKDTKPAVDKVKEKTGKEKGEKLGEREDTIPPEYRLKEVKDKDGKPMLPKAEEKPKPMSDTELLDALTEGFVTSPQPQQSGPSPALKKDAKKSAGSEEVVSCSKASAVQASAPPASGADESIPDDALDLLSGTLGKREVDPDEHKPMVDKVKEKATKEYIAKLGECDETIPPEYRALLDGDGKDKPVKPTIPEKPKGPQDDTAAIDALSKGFSPASPVESATQTPKDKSAKDSAPSKPACKEESKTKEPPKDKSGKDAPAAKPAAKDEVKAKGPEKTKEQSSSVKSDTQKKSKS